MRSSAAKNLAVQMYSAAGFGESTSDLAWDGHGLVAERGELVAETERFALDGHAVVADVDLAGARRGPHAADVVGPERRRRTAATLRRVAVAAPATTGATPARLPTPRSAASTRIRSCRPTRRARRALPRDLPHQGDRRSRAASQALPEDAPPHRRSASRAASDSTQALLVAVHAMDLLGLPRTDVLGVTMPGFGTSQRHLRERLRARARARRHAARGRHQAARRRRSSRRSATTPRSQDVTFENVQAWARKFVLFSIASQERGIDLGTGDLSELALGFATYGGDHMSHYGVNAGVPKTLVSELIRWAADTHLPRRAGGRARCCATSSTRRSAPSCCRRGRRRRDRAALRGPRRPLRAARLLPLLLPALRLRPAPHRAHGAARVRRPLRRSATIRRWLLVFLQILNYDPYPGIKAPIAV